MTTEAADSMSSPSRQYIEKHQLNTLFKELLVSLLIEQPEEPIPFLVMQLQERASMLNRQSSHITSLTSTSTLSESDTFTNTILHPLGGLTKKSITQRFRDTHGDDASNAIIRNARRGSVSAEPISISEHDETSATIIPKSDEARMRIATAIANNLLFRNLDHEQRQPVIDAMFERKVTLGEVVITQGEEGDNFYVVDQGTFDIFVNGKKVVDVGPGDSFGELALMYNTPRAATITATSEAILWGVDRGTFRKSITGYSFRKRKMYTDFLKTVPLLTKLNDTEIAKLADALEPVNYEDGDDIIEQGDHGHRFYLIERGEVEVTKTNFDGTLLHLPSLSVGDYFGELALLHNRPRAATVTAKGSVRVAALGKDAFTRLLGPAVDVMKRRSQTYGQIDKEALAELLRNGRPLHHQHDETADDSSTATEDN